MARRLSLPTNLYGRASLWFDGVDDVVTGVGTPLSGNQAATIVAWLRFEHGRESSSYELALCSGSPVGRGALWIGMNTNRIMGGLYGVVDCNSSIDAVPQLRYRRVVLTYNTDKAMVIYVDGVPSAFTAGNTANFAGSPTLGCTAGMAYKGNISDARIYTRVWTPEEAAADALGEWVSDTGLVRRWTCENPGSGATCHEEIGNTDDAITGALWSFPPFRKPRKIENVTAAPLLSTTVSLTITDHDDLDPGTGSFSMMGWIWVGSEAGRPASQRAIFNKIGVLGDPGFIFYQYSGGQPAWLISSGGSYDFFLHPAKTLRRATWTHVAVTRDATTSKLRMCIDLDTADYTTAITGTVSNAVNLTVCGPSWGTWSTAAVNNLVLCKGTALSITDIEAHYYEGIVPASATCHWPMTEGSGTTITDSIAGRNGSISSDSWTTNTRCKVRSVS